MTASPRLFFDTQVLQQDTKVANGAPTGFKYSGAPQIRAPPQPPVAIPRS